MTFYEAKFDSVTFCFSAFGKTKLEAFIALKAGLDQHTKDYRLAADWWHEFEDDIYAVEVGFDGCYRDNEAILETK